MTERKAKPLTPEEVEAYCDALRQKDLRYAGDLDACQTIFLKSKPRIKNWQEFKTIEDIKRVMIGLHEDRKSVSVTSGDQTITIKWED